MTTLSGADIAAIVVALKASGLMGGEDREKGDWKKNLMKHLGEFDGDKGSYNNWSLKMFMNVNSASADMVEVLKAMAELKVEIDVVEMAKMVVKYPEPRYKVEKCHESYSKFSVSNWWEKPSPLSKA